MKKKMIALLSLLLCLALAFAIQLALPKTQNVDAESEPAAGEQEVEKGRIEVNGNGVVLLKPDYAHLYLAVVENGESASEATQRNNAAMEKVFALLDSLGISKDDYHTTSFNVWPRYDYSSAGYEVRTFHVENQIIVKVRDIEKVGEIIASALDNGVNNINQIVYGVEDTSEAYADALKLAVESAREKAQVLAEASGQEIIAKPILITEGTNYYYGDRAAGGAKMAVATEAAMDSLSAIPLSEQQVEVSAQVTIVYATK